MEDNTDLEEIVWYLNCEEQMRCQADVVSQVINNSEQSNLKITIWMNLRNA